MQGTLFSWCQAIVSPLIFLQHSIIPLRRPSLPVSHSDRESLTRVDPTRLSSPHSGETWSQFCLEWG